MSPITTTDSMVAMDEIFVIGFDNQFEDYLLSYRIEKSNVHIRSFESSFVAYRWLQRNKLQLPLALICNHQFLQQEHFLLARNLQSDEQLRGVPFITISERKSIDKMEAFKLGIDEVYDAPVFYPQLEEKIQFLARYKPLIVQEKQEEKVELIPQYKIPFTKRIFDILISLSAIICLMPIWLLIAIAIKLESKGSIIYRSKRVGTGYQVFDFLKFRSMYQDADQRLKEYEHLNQYKGEDDDIFKKISNDPRVTKVGRLIRKTSLDELPQLLNVLRGEMSVVGNRPLPLYEAEMLTKDDWARRFLAPAGCTGLWQISKRGKAEMSSEERINLDVTYAENYSFWYDLKIMLKTLPALIQDENV